MNSGGVMIKLNNISFSYHATADNHIVLNDISVAFKPQSLTCLVGKSGAGKSTLLRLISGKLKPDSGQVLINDTDIWALNKEARTQLLSQMIGFVHQDFKLISDMSNYNNIILPAILHNKTLDNSFLEELFNRLEIADILDRFPKQISGGQQQRIAVARAMALKPALILADEPTGNLDQATSQHLIDFVRQLNHSFNQSFVIATHDRDLSQIADYVYRIQDGSVENETA